MCTKIMCKKDNVVKQNVQKVELLICPAVEKCTVGENIIATTKIRNNYGAIQSFIFPLLR